MSPFEERLRENILLHPYSTLGIGGPARYFIEAEDNQTVIEAVQWSNKNKLPLFVLGGGSNILVSDRGFPGLVLHISIRGLNFHEENGKIIVEAGAGEEWDKFVAYAIAKDWGGIECMSGIPGRVGATPIQNVGAYGQEVKETIVSVTAYDRLQDKIIKLSSEECGFGYRSSIFKSEAKDRYIVLSVVYALDPNGEPSIRYPELQNYISERISGKPSLSVVREAVIAIRRRKAMVIDPNDSDSRSVGSFFVNPVIDQSQFESLASIFDSDEKIPKFAAAEGRVKLSAAWLIEKAGFPKGYKHGCVGISSKHALAIVNRGGGSAEEAIELMEKIQSGVKEKFDIALVPEPVFVGLFATENTEN